MEPGKRESIGEDCCVDLELFYELLVPLKCLPIPSRLEETAQLEQLKDIIVRYKYGTVHTYSNLYHIYCSVFNVAIYRYPTSMTPPWGDASQRHYWLSIRAAESEEHVPVLEAPLWLPRRCISRD